ncbi:11226_t:CDS:2, partial [Gigaspora margarita]
ENMAKQLNKKQKVNNTGNDKENAFYNSYDALNSTQYSKRHHERMEQLLNRAPQREAGRNTETPMEGVNQEPKSNEVQLEEQTLEQELIQDSAEGKDQDALSLQGDVTDNNSHKNWAALFSKLKRGRATFSTFSSRNAIKSKNNNALIIDIHNIQ